VTFHSKGISDQNPPREKTLYNLQGSMHPCYITTQLSRRSMSIFLIVDTANLTAFSQKLSKTVYHSLGEINKI